MLIAVVLIAGFVAVRQVGATAAAKALAREAKADAIAWQAHGDSIQELADSLQAANDILAEETARQRQAVARIKAESDSILGVLQEQRRTIRNALTLSAANFRKALPAHLVPLFDEHERLHIAELSASEHETAQVQRKLDASEAFILTQSLRIMGLVTSDSLNAEGWANEEIQSALWKESSDKWEAAASPGFFGKLLGDVPKYLTGAVAGILLVGR